MKKKRVWPSLASAPSVLIVCGPYKTFPLGRWDVMGPAFAERGPALDKGVSSKTKHDTDDLFTASSREGRDSMKNSKSKGQNLAKASDTAAPSLFKPAPCPVWF